MPKRKSAYERKLEYNNAYNRENYRSFSIRYDKESEKEIIRWLENQEGVKSYITELILQDMERESRTSSGDAKKSAEKSKGLK